MSWSVRAEQCLQGECWGKKDKLTGNRKVSYEQITMVRLIFELSISILSLGCFWQYRAFGVHGAILATASALQNTPLATLGCVSSGAKLRRG
jgi:hypothetical protein